MTPTGTVQGFRLSPAQRRCWRLLARSAGSAAEVRCQIAIEGALSAPTLRQALARVVARHEILRTRFEQPPGLRLPVQVISAEAEPPELEELDWRQWPPGEQEAGLAADLEREEPAFSPQRGPLLQARWFLLARERSVLALRASSLIADLPSLAILGRELAAFCRGGAPAAEVELQFADIAEWQAELLSGEESASAREFWARREWGGAARVDLPGAGAAGASGFRPQLASGWFGPALAAGFRRLAAEVGVDPELLSLAAWCTLVARRTGEADLVVGLGSNGRSVEPLAAAVGPLARSLPLRSAIAPGESLLELAQRLAREREELLKWQDYLDPEAEITEGGLRFGFDATALPAIDGAGAPRFSLGRARGGYEPFVLRLLTDPRGEELALCYDANRVSAELAERVALGLATLWTAVLAPSEVPGHERPLLSLPVLSAAESRQLVTGFNATAVARPSGITVRDLLLRPAAERSEAVALVFAGEHSSYQALARAARALALELSALGVGPEVRVGLAARRSPVLIAALLAIVEAGGAFVPLDPENPPDRLAAMAADAGVSTLLVGTEVADRLAGLELPRLLLPATLPSAEAPAPGVALDPQNLAYVLFTSGSTGRPKGVMISHGALCNHLLWLPAAHGSFAGRRMLQKTPLSFDVAVREIFWPLVSGATLVVAEPDGHRDSAYLARLAREQGVGVLNFVPSLLRQVLAEGELEHCPQLERVLVGGEALPAELAREFMARVPARLVNQYGPTEATITATTALCTEGEAASVWPIGRPLDNTRLVLLDSHLGLVPLGAPGEIFLAGAGLARGYSGRPGQTAASFLPDSTSEVGGGRAYRTGDLGRLRGDGSVEFLGRRDHQVKVRGFRIELEEIEAAFRRHPTVFDVAVAAWEPRPGDQRLAAYVVAAAGRTAQPNELKKAVAEQLPDYMVPSAITVLPSLPRTPTGKLDRRALPPPSAAPAEAAFQAPSGTLEETVAEIWAEALGCERVGRHDSFFDIGGHSLLATQVVSRLRHTLQLEVPLRSLFEAPTVSSLARLLAELSSQGRGLSLPPIAAAAAGEDPPPSFAQERLWFLDQLTPGSPLYNIPAALWLDGQLSVEGLQRALAAVVARHEVLRTTFPTRDGRSTAVVQAAAPVPIPVLDLSALGVGRAAAMGVVRRELARPFDLARGPLLRALLVRVGPLEHCAVLTLHHIVSDGESTGVLIREVAALYAAFLAGVPATLPALPIQYGDYAAWQRRWLRDQVREELLAFWRAELAGLPALLELPTDRPRPAVRKHRGTSLFFTLPAPLCLALRGVGRRAGATPFMVFLAAYQTLLWRTARQADIAVGSPVSGRDRLELETLIGLFVNTLVLRTRLSARQSFAELLERVRDGVLRAHAHQALPFEQLVDALEPERNLSSSPLFQTMLVLQAARAEELRLGDLRLEVEAITSETAKFDLILTLAERAEGWQGAFELDLDLFDASTIARLEGHLMVLLEGIATDPATRLCDLPWLTAAEREAVLAGARTSPLGLSPEATLHGAVAAQAAARPEAIAVADGGELLSYGELTRRARRLGARLRGCGVGPEVPVALCSERSAEMIVALLGVLDSGGFYVPLDPAYPELRLAFLLADAGPRCLLAAPAVDVEMVQRLAANAGLRLLWLGEPAAAAEAAAAPGPLALAEHPAYAIYTSGSTGQPKGVLVTHGNVLRLFAATAPWFGSGPADRWSLFHSFAFDFSVWEIWGALVSGGCVVVVPHPMSRAPEAFYDLLARHRVTSLSQTPSAFRQLMQVAAADSRPGELALEVVVFGGEALEPPSLGPWIERFGDQRPRLINMFGITETTVHVTYRPLSRADVEAAGASPIGTPIPDLAVLVLDELGQLLPVGVPGELNIAGAGLARGYLGRPGQTASRFVPHPYSEEPGARLYRSGDLGRRLAGGELEYLGRGDEQVKIRGFRIELGEINAALAELPEVAQAAVVLREDAPGEKRLVAYVVAAGEEPGSERLRQGLLARLPSHMVPAAFVFLPALPLTINGKLDRRALPPPSRERGGLTQTYVEPASTPERQLAEIWCEVLGQTRVGATDNFFTLGGDSILSIQVVARAKERGLVVTLPQIFQHQTIRELAAAVQPLGGGAAFVPSEPFSLVRPEDLARLDRERLADAYPLTALQAGMLYHMQAGENDEEPPYFNVDVWRLKGRLSWPALVEATRRVTRRHPVLRTAFDLEECSEPLQLVYREVEPVLSLCDLRRLEDAEQRRVIAQFQRRRRRRQIDLGRPPQLEIHLHLLAAASFTLTLVENHAILDGWSLHATLAEIFDLHQALATAGEAAELPPIPVAFRDFVRLEREATHSEETRRYFRDRLAGYTYLEPPRWPREEGAAAGPQTRIRRLPISSELSAAIKATARRLELPLKTLALTVHLKALSLLTGMRDLLTGQVSNGRPEAAGGEEVRGLFLNTLPFRFRLEPGSWRELARAVFAAEQAQLPHRRYPLPLIQELVGSERLFEVGTNYVHFHVADRVLSAGGLELVEVMLGEAHNVHLSATFGLDPGSARFFLQMSHHTQVIPEPLARRAEGLYLAALEALVRDPEAAHDHLLGSAADDARRQREWNDTHLDFASRPLVPELVALQASAQGDAIAVSGEEGQLSYGELDRRANELAHQLRDLGLGPDSLALVADGRTLVRVVANLAVLKAGAAYVSLDAEVPAERLRYLLADTGAAVVLAAPPLLAQLPAAAAPMIALEGLGPAPSPRAGRAPHCLAEPKNLAYVIYTSGSTGEPKGVAITHHNLSSLVAWQRELYRVEAEDRGSHGVSPAFDASMFELWPFLAQGARICIPPESARSSAAATVAWWREHRLTLPVLTAGPLEEVLAMNLGPEAGLAVRAISTGADRLRRRPAPDAPFKVLNHYGPTECTVAVTASRVAASGAGLPAIGRPVANAQLWVVDDLGRLAAIGVPGELAIGGPSVGRGYLGRPAATAAAFVPDSWSGEAGARLYRSGDRVRLRPDGELDFLGRRDDQVKIRGFRVEPGEVEAALARHPSIKAAAVVVMGDAEERRLAAYLEPEAGCEPSPGELNAFLAERLPSYMIPADLIAVDLLPRTALGKVDRRALLAASGRRLSPSALDAPPRTPTEELLAELWREVLKTEAAIGSNSDFFELGGHSLSATRAVARIGSLFGVEIGLRQLFETPTLGALAAAIDGALSDRERTELPAIERVPADQPAALSFAQQRLWFLDRLEPGTPAYNMAISVRLSGQLRIAALLGSLREIVRRHETLRTRFELAADGGPVQVVVPELRLAMPVLDLAALTAGEGPGRDLVTRCVRQPFDLARGPLLRVWVLRLATREHVVVLTLHHIVSDGWSMDLLVGELAALYTAFAAEAPSPLPELPIQYRDFAAWQRRHLGGDALAAGVDYWRRQLAPPLGVIRLPGAKPPASPPSYAGGHHGFVLDRRLAAEVKALCRGEKVTLFMVLLAAFKALLFRLSGESDVVVGTDVAGRGRAETEGLIGFFVNLLALRTDLSGRPTFRTLLARVRSTVLSGFAHQDIPFDKLVEELSPGRGMGHAPFFQILFVLQPPAAPRELPGLSLHPFTAELATTRFDLALFLSERDGELAGSFSFRTSLFEPAAVRELARRFQTLLADALAHPERRLDELSLLTDEEKQEQTMQTEDREKASFARFKSVKPKAVQLPGGELVRTRLLSERGFPLLVEPEAPDLDLAAWAKSSAGKLDELLSRHGALLFRGFPVATVTDFERFAGAVCPTLFGEYGDLPKAGEGKKVYNSTPYPADKTILFHHESSHMHQWPMRQFFYCVQPAQSGGETPLVDGRQIYQQMDPEVREVFERKGLLYVRNFTEALDVPWQTFFHTDDRAEVEAYCRANGIGFEWTATGLRTRQAAPAVVVHPKTGEKVFFNQIQLHHIAMMEAGEAEALRSMFGEENLPRNVYFGDGSPIPNEVARDSLALYWRLAVALPWQAGDVITVDNMLVAHARNPFSGPRRIAVAMGDLVRRERLAS